MTIFPKAHSVKFARDVTVPPAWVPFALDQMCPLCGSRAQASEGIVEAKLSLLSCGRCRAFVIEEQLLDVIMNARAWNLPAVLRHVAFLSRAAQSAAAQGAVLVVTSTNWIRVAIERQRLEEQALPAGEPQRVVHAAPASF